MTLLTTLWHRASSFTSLVWLFGVFSLYVIVTPYPCATAQTVSPETQVSVSPVEGTATSPPEEPTDDALSEDQQPKTLTRALTLIAQRATERLRPDIRNGLIRIAVLTAQGDAIDLPAREALSGALAQIVSELPNVYVVAPMTTRQTLRRFSALNLPLTVERSISLGQHLGARYLLHLTTEAGPKPGQVKLITQVISVKLRGVVINDEHIVQLGDLTQFRDKLVFDESRLGATWRSLVFPGWGQLYQGRTGAAIAYMATSVGLIAGGIWSYTKGSSAAQRYQEDTRETVIYRQEANQHFDRARLIWGALGVTWLSSVASSFIMGEDRSHIQLNFDPTHGGLSFSGVF